MRLGILQARMGSSRLPGKVLQPILGTPMLGRQLERLARCRTLDRIVIATSTEPSDDRLVEWAHAEGHRIHRGPLEDVLDRFIGAAEAHSARWIVRLTGDCPLTDPDLIDRVVHAALEADFDYFSNIDPPTWPDGMDVEVVRTEVLRLAGREARLSSEREHVTPFVRNHPERFSHGVLRSDIDLSHLRLTVDQQDDFELVRRIFEALLPFKPEFGLADILEVLKANPEWLMLNANLERNEGYRKSLAADSEVT